MLYYKKIASGIICLMLTVSTIGVSAYSIQEDLTLDCTVFAEEIKLSNGLVTEQVNGEIIITGCDKSATSVEIPDKLDEYHVVAIKDGAFSGCDKLTKVDMIEGYITSIGKNTFSECVNLSEILISDTVTSIDQNAFVNCKKIQIKCNKGSYAEKYANENNIPFSYIEKSEPEKDEPVVHFGWTEDGLKYQIENGRAAIEGLDDKVTEVTIPEEIEGCPVTSMKPLLSQNLTKITVSDSLECIDGDLFKGFHNLSQINASATSKKYVSVDGVLFNKDKTALLCYPMGKKETTYSIPDSVTNIGNLAFNICNNLTKMVVPEGVTAIGEGSFMSCDSLTSITLPKSLKVIGKDAFRFCGITEIEIPDGVEYIEKGTFFNCRKLKKVTLPDSIVSIGDEAFSACTCEDFTEITIPKNVTSIGQRAFMYSKNIKKISVLGEIKSINEATFAACTNLSDIRLPASIESIGMDAFDNCGSLTSITLPDNLKTMSYRVFNNCSNLASISISEKNTEYSSSDGILFNKDKTTICCYPAGKKGTSYSIPESVTEVGGGAFMSCILLTEINLPDTVTKIGDSSFERCKGMKSIVLPDSVKIIGEFTFCGCEELTEITVPDGVQSLKEETFTYCDKLKKIILPDSIISIDDCTFGKQTENYVLSVVKGSYAEKFAQDHEMNFEIKDSQKTVKAGDINGDGKIAVWDLVMLKQHITGMKTLNGTEIKAADINSDGKVDVFDCIRVRRMILEQ